MPTIDVTPETLEATYRKMEERLAVVRERLNRPLTLAEKIVFGHLDDPENQVLEAGSAYLQLRPDRVIMQDATAQMAILQFMSAGVPQVKVPATVHCDHLIAAQRGAAADLGVAVDENREVYDFLKSACAKYGIGFWGPGSGIIHQVVLENYAVPGALVIGSDSHTPNAGGLGTVAIGVGGADTVDVMAGFPWEVLQPKLVGVKLTGELSGWTAPKDVILKLCGLLTVKGGTNRIVEYFGPGVKSLSTTGKATITNMGAELGATTSVFPYDQRAAKYLEATGRADLIPVIERHADLFRPDAEVEQLPQRFYDQIVEIDLATLEPHVVGPHTPDLARPVSQLAKDAAEHGYPVKLSSALVGSCTNSSYEDISRAADVARQAEAHGAKMAIPFLVSPGSEQVYETVKRDGQMKELEAVGATVLANACGPCIGQWKRPEVQKGEKNSIITSFNRNFPGRNDANPETYAFIASPEVTMAFGLVGDLTINPLTAELAGEGGKRWKLQPPAPAPEVPSNGFVSQKAGYQAPAADPAKVTVEVKPGSERLQVLEPFSAKVIPEFADMPVLFKSKGKTTTDHISPAGAWLRYRGHLDRISDNMLTGATNAWTGERGKTSNAFTGETGDVPQVARDYKARGKRWVIVGDENYGEGSSREHAAMSPRFLGCAAVITRSFARIHESNLKKQGILPLTFCDPADYEKVRQGDRISLENLQDLAPSRHINALLHHADGTSEVVSVKHTMNMEQIAWFNAGSALNLLREVEGKQALAR